MGAPGIEWEALPTGVGRALSRVVEASDWRETIGAALAEVGEALGVDRCLVFGNRRGSDGRLWMELCAEWNGVGVAPAFPGAGPQMHPYYPAFARWIEELGQGRGLVGRLSDRPASERETLAAAGTVSFARVPVLVGDEWWGSVGVDVCRTTGVLTEDDVAVLEQVAAAIAEAIRRGRAAEDDRLREDVYRSMVEHGPAVTYIDGVDDHASTVFISPQIAELLGYTPDEWVADPDLWAKVLHPDDRARALAENARHNETGERFRLEYRMFHKDGGIVWVHDEAAMVRDEHGAPRYSHGVLVDISERKRGEERLAFEAYHDQLTGLPTRAMFDELLDLSVARARRQEGAVAVLSVDVNDFRLVNDSLGHASGDLLLQQLADRLREATRETDLVARRTADQFLLLLSDLDPDEDASDGAVMRAQAVAHRIQDSLTSPFDVAGTEVYVSASIGISVFPLDAPDAATLRRNAEAATFEAKKTAASSFVMASGGREDSSAKLQFVTRLRKAVETQRWTLHYQPVLQLETGAMTGVEALIRWIEADGTMVPPLEFIPLAEELGLIEQIGDWVVRELTYQIQAWRELDIDLEVGFNLSPRQFWQPDLAERIVRAVRSSDVDPSKVMVEVTESSAMMDPDRAQGILMDLHEAGFAIAIDDFGTGYSSLSRLRDMPVDVLKIDRSFVRNLHEDAEAASIVSAFLELARGLGITTLAEGIETEEELAFLRERGCRLGQGFYFSRPVPPEEIIAYAFGGIPNAMALRG
jgi:diguanylate cyclase (GGDEF)-like protein/PAS domain S-box-containing protein